MAGHILHPGGANFLRAVGEIVPPVEMTSVECNMECLDPPTSECKLHCITTQLYSNVLLLLLLLFFCFEIVEILRGGKKGKLEERRGKSP